MAQPGFQRTRLILEATGKPVNNPADTVERRRFRKHKKYMLQSGMKFFRCSQYTLSSSYNKCPEKSLEQVSPLPTESIRAIMQSLLLCPQLAVPSIHVQA